jgi:hypothetical protein
MTIAVSYSRKREHSAALSGQPEPEFISVKREMAQSAKPANDTTALMGFAH